MTRVILLEDEPAALRRLQRLIAEIRPSWEIVGTADSLVAGEALIRAGGYELILTDIHLSDGLFFDLGTRVRIEAPVIFITAYDEYAIRAFRLNSIHYLVKPLDAEMLNEAFNKFEKRQLSAVPDMAGLFPEGEPRPSLRLLSRVGNRTVVIPVEELALVYTADRATMAVLFSGKEHLLDQSLDVLMQNLDEKAFFRINRQWIVHREAVLSFRPHTSHRLLLSTRPAVAEELVVSKEKTPLFRQWMSQ